MNALTVAYIDKLQRANADDLAFYPLSTLAQALDARHVLTCYENDEPAGYLWYGSVRGGYDVTIYQACVDYDARRRHLGWQMVADLVLIANAGGAVGIRLKCASSADSNIFWQAAGFYCTNVTNGGIKRGRQLNHYRTDLTSGLFRADVQTPSAKLIDLRVYQALKREGTTMPSRFSRSHYGRTLTTARSHADVLLEMADA